MELRKSIKKYNLTDFKIMDIIGKGTNAQVHFTKNTITNKHFSLKIIKKNEVVKFKQVDHIMNEINILHIIDHPFIIKIEGWFQDSKYLYLVFQLVLGGELYSILRTMETCETHQVKFYASQIITIFEYLHSKNILYRDLKPENVLLDRTGYIKLSDFGYAKMIDGKTYTLCGTPEYLAPEIILNKGHGAAVDWWALGIFIYELMAGFCPFMSDDTLSVYKNILKGTLKFPRDFDKDAKSICRHLIERDLSKRYGNLKNKAEDIKNHTFFQEINFQELLNYELKPPFIPIVRCNTDLNNFPELEDSIQDAKQLDSKDDPFINW